MGMGAYVDIGGMTGCVGKKGRLRKNEDLQVDAIIQQARIAWSGMG